MGISEKDKCDNLLVSEQQPRISSLITSGDQTAFFQGNQPARTPSPMSFAPCDQIIGEHPDPSFPEPLLSGKK